MKVSGVSSAEPGNGDGSALAAVDGNPSTMWHSAWSRVSPPAAYPHWISFVLGSKHELAAFDYTELPALVQELATKVYATYFVGRGDQQWADAHPEQRTRIYLMSERTPAMTDGELAIDVMAPWFAQQVRPDTDCDISRWWQVIDRSTGCTIPAQRWSLQPDGRTVLVSGAQAGHLYTVDFLAEQVWDPTQMYNHLTNNWGDDPSRIKESPYDVRHEQT